MLTDAAQTPEQIAAWAAWDGDQPKERQPISTAPRDGTVIIVGDPDVGEFPMSWGHIQRNEVFAPGVTGMWIMQGGGMTWTEHDGFGPTAWRALDAEPVRDVILSRQQAVRCEF